MPPNFNEFLAQWTNEYVELNLDKPSESTVRDLLGDVAESYSRSSSSWDSLVKVRGQWGARIARVQAEVNDHKKWIVDENTSVAELDEWNKRKRHLQAKAKASARKLQFFLFLSERWLNKFEDPLRSESDDLKNRRLQENETYFVSRYAGILEAITKWSYKGPAAAYEKAKDAARSRSSPPPEEPPARRLSSIPRTPPRSSSETPGPRAQPPAPPFKKPAAENAPSVTRGPPPRATPSTSAQAATANPQEEASSEGSEPFVDVSDELQTNRRSLAKDTSEGRSDAAAGDSEPETPVLPQPPEGGLPPPSSLQPSDPNAKVATQTVTRNKTQKGKGPPAEEADVLSDSEADPPPPSKEERAFRETQQVLEQTDRTLDEISRASGAPDLSEVKQAQLALNVAFQNRHIVDAIKKAKKQLTKLSTDLEKKQQEAKEDERGLDLCRQAEDHQIGLLRALHAIRNQIGRLEKLGARHDDGDQRDADQRRRREQARLLRDTGLTALAQSTALVDPGGDEFRRSRKRGGGSLDDHGIPLPSDPGRSGHGGSAGTERRSRSGEFLQKARESAAAGNLDAFRTYPTHAPSGNAFGARTFSGATAGSGSHLQGGAAGSGGDGGGGNRSAAYGTRSTTVPHRSGAARPNHGGGGGGDGGDPPSSDDDDGDRRDSDSDRSSHEVSQNDSDDGDSSPQRRRRGGNEGGRRRRMPGDPIGTGLPGNATVANLPRNAPNDWRLVPGAELFLFPHRAIRASVAKPRIDTYFSGKYSYGDNTWFDFKDRVKYFLEEWHRASGSEQEAVLEIAKALKGEAAKTLLTYKNVEFPWIWGFLALRSRAEADVNLFRLQYSEVQKLHKVSDDADQLGVLLATVEMFLMQTDSMIEQPEDKLDWVYISHFETLLGEDARKHWEKHKMKRIDADRPLGYRNLHAWKFVRVMKKYKDRKAREPQTQRKKHKESGFFKVEGKKKKTGAAAPAAAGTPPKRGGGGGNVGGGKKTFAVGEGKVKYRCGLCATPDGRQSLDHSIPMKCPRKATMSDMEIRQTVLKNGACISCFTVGHRVRECEAGYTCKVNGCKEKHAPQFHEVKSTRKPDNGRQQQQGRANTVQPQQQQQQNRPDATLLRSVNSIQATQQAILAKLAEQPPPSYGAAAAASSSGSAAATHRPPTSQ